MWVLTVFKQDTYHFFEYETKEEAQEAQENTEFPSIITFTTLSLVA
ncbi:hypothetical protein [Ureibacillus manganicus]|nr:hypothetical protein [Ureibacillus manganicus]